MLYQQLSRMPFKIVKIIENGKFCLWTVPESWESDGILRCPRFKFEILRQDQLSVPQDTWQVIDCVLMKSNFCNFEDAENEIRRKKGGNRDEIKKASSNSPAIEELFAGILAAEGSKSKSANSQEKSQEKAGTYKNEIPFTEYSEISSKIDAITTLVSGIAKKQSELCDNQNIIKNKLSDITSKFDEVIKRTSVSLSPEKSKQRIGRMKPIADVKSLDEFEESLKDELTAKELKNTFSIICGVGKGRGINNAYALIDAMIDRMFLRECSWSGGSRGDTTKVCFKSYKNTINLFFQIVYSSDKKFTLMECENFFKTILRNAMKRSHSKKMRASRMKNRQKRKQLLQQTIETNSLDIVEFVELENANVRESAPAEEQEVLKLEMESESGNEDSDYVL